jgi:hypothetical protein
LRTGLDPDSLKPFNATLAYQLYKEALGPIEQVISEKTQ